VPSPHQQGLHHDREWTPTTSLIVPCLFATLCKGSSLGIYRTVELYIPRKTPSMIIPPRYAQCSKLVNDCFAPTEFANEN
jgi:hypothetical protein